MLLGVALGACATPDQGEVPVGVDSVRLEVSAPDAGPRAVATVPEHRRLARLRLVNDTDSSVEFWGYGPRQPICAPLLGGCAPSPRTDGDHVHTNGGSRWRLGPRSSFEFDAALGLGASRFSVEVACGDVVTTLCSPIVARAD